MTETIRTPDDPVWILFNQMGDVLGVYSEEERAVEAMLGRAADFGDPTTQHGAVIRHDEHGHIMFHIEPWKVDCR